MLALRLSCEILCMISLKVAHNRDESFLLEKLEAQF